MGGVHDEEEFLAVGCHVLPVSGGTREAAAANRYLPSRFLFTAVKLRPAEADNRRFVSITTNLQCMCLRKWTLNILGQRGRSYNSKWLRLRFAVGGFL